MNTIHTILQTLDSITLKEMDKVKLMDRTDTKFIFTAQQLQDILSQVNSDYRILEIDGKRISRYKTLYYDTANLDLYKRHHNGELNRYKVRHRSYVESNIGFLEVKFKNNKGRTIKDRIKKTEAFMTLEGESKSFLDSKLPFDAQTLLPVLWVNYSRLTLVNKTSAERLTIDLDLEFIKDQEHQAFSNLVIAEVKQEKKKGSPFLKIMKSKHIREGSISKYCLGIAVTHASVKQNNFKEKLIAIKKIINDDKRLIASI